MKRIQTLILASCFLFSFKIYSQSTYDIQDFEEGVIPETWTIYDMNDDGRKWESDFRTSVSGDWCAGVSANMDGTKYDWLITPPVLPNSENHTLTFFAKSQIPLPEYLEDFKVKVSVTNTLPESFIDLIGEETSIPADWNQFSYDLSAYQNQQIYIAIINESFDKSVMFIDDISAPYFFFDNDLLVKSIEGSTTPGIGFPETYYIRVKNNGWQTQANYQVILYEHDGTEIATVEGESIDPFQQVTIPVQWTPDEAISTSIYAEVIFQDDEDPSNNRSKDWYVSVHTLDMLTNIQGMFSEKEYSPLFFPAKTSLSESIYLGKDIGFMGNLIEIDYSAIFQFEVREKNIRIWVGETDKSELNMEWIPASELTLVYDGNITVPKNQHMIPIRFQTPYHYTGGNLVIMVERSWDDSMYGYDNQFNVTESERISTIQYEQNFETTDPNNPSVDPWWTKSVNYLPDIHLIFDIQNTGSLAGTVTDQDSTPVANAKVYTDEAGIVVYTNSEGQYNIPYIFEGEYQFHAGKHGYYDGEGDITIQSNQAQQLNIILNQIPLVTVTGKVTGNDNPEQGIQNAGILMEGYENYQSITDELGVFTIEGVYSNKIYNLTIDATGFLPYSATIEVSDQSLDLGTIILTELTPPPIQVTANDMNMLAMVSWIDPYGFPENEFRYDDGNADMQIGFEEPLPNAVMGAVFPSNSIIKSVSWFLTDEENHDSIQILVFGLDLMGKPDVQKIYYQSGMIPNIDNQWNSVEMPSYIDAPEGFFVGVNTPNQFISLGTDDGIGEPYEFRYGTYYVNPDWTSGSEWVDAGELGCYRNMMVRANGYKFGFNNKMPADSSRDLENYQVFRLMKGDENFEERWDTLSTNYTSTFFEDFGWESLSPGTYRYAVKAGYTNSVYSYARFSNDLVKKQTFNVNITVTTNSSDPVTGANFNINAVQGYPGYSYSTILDESGNISLNAVPVDTYYIDLSLTGFGEVHVSDIQIQSDTSLVFRLEELFKNPYNLNVDIAEGNAYFSWNNKPNAITEDFESYEDFSLNFGDWTNINADDMSSITIQEVNFPHNGEKLGFMVFNPEATQPAMMDITAYSGQRCAAAICAGEGMSDDWLISPKTSVVEGSVFKFMARSTSDMWELSTLRVAVSTSDQSPENFVTIPEYEFIMAPYWNWTEFIVDLSEYAGQDVYVAIEHTSVESYILLIDDLYIGVPEPTTRSLTDYTVYLDGVPVGNTTENNYTFSNLIPNQSYIAGVRANYTTGYSETETISFIAPNPFGLEEGKDMQIKLYPNPSHGVVNLSMKNGRGAKIDIINASGFTVYSTICIEDQQTISLSNLAKGTYLMKAQTLDRNISTIFIVN